MHTLTEISQYIFVVKPKTLSLVPIYHALSDCIYGLFNWYWIFYVWAAVKSNAVSSIYINTKFKTQFCKRKLSLGLILCHFNNCTSNFTDIIGKVTSLKCISNNKMAYTNFVTTLYNLMTQLTAIPAEAIVIFFIINKQAINYMYK